MSRLIYPQRRIRACDRILRNLYWRLKRSMKRPAESGNLEYEDKIQEDINWYEQTKESIEISL